MKLKTSHFKRTIFFALSLIISVLFVIGCRSKSDKFGDKDWTGKVMTVNGLIPADSVGITLPHEHLLIEHTKATDLTDVSTAIAELQYFADAGGKTLVDATNIGIGRKPQSLKQISDSTGVNVIMGTGFYKEKWIPDSIKEMSVKELTDIMINDVIQGIDGVHAGFIGEIGLTGALNGEFEKRVLKSSAHAQKATGAAINLHFDVPGEIKTRFKALIYLKLAGADLSRVYISHNLPYPSLVDTYVWYARLGCYVAFDMFGLEVFEGMAPKFDQKLEPVKTIKAMIDRGFIDHILISQDVCINHCYVKNGGYGYAHILNDIVPKFKAAGITDEQIKTIMVENPKRILTFKNY